MKEWLLEQKDAFILNFIDGDRWQYITDGLITTLKITFCALLIGFVLGVVIAAVRATYDNNHETMHRSRSFYLL